MSPIDVLTIILVVAGIVIAAFYFINKWASKRMVEQQDFIDKNRQSATIYVIDKKRDKPANANLPKAALEQMPKYAKFMKMYFVKAKVGPQIVTLMCEKDMFNALPVKKNVKVELSGLYISNMKGMRSREEMKEIEKARKQKEKETKKAAKQ